MGEYGNRGGGDGGDGNSAPSAELEVRFDGLVMANVSTFTMSPDRRIVSAIFDDFTLERLPAAEGEAAAEAEALDHARRLVIALPPTARGRRVSAQLRGFWSAAGGDSPAPELILRLGANAHPATLPPQEGDIALDAEAMTAPDDDVLVVEIEARIPPPAAESAAGEVHLTVDSIDLALLD